LFIIQAVISPDKSELVLAVLNKSDRAKTYRLNLNTSAKISNKSTVYRTSSTENCTKVSAPNLKSRSVLYEAPGLSLTTFILTSGK